MGVSAVVWDSVRLYGRARGMYAHKRLEEETQNAPLRHRRTESDVLNASTPTTPTSHLQTSGLFQQFEQGTPPLHYALRPKIQAVILSGALRATLLMTLYALQNVMRRDDVSVHRVEKQLKHHYQCIYSPRSTYVCPIRASWVQTHC